MTSIYDTIAYNIKKYRKKRKLKQHQLAEMTGFSYEFIRRIEAKNCVKSFSLETVYIISEALDLPLEKLFEEDGKVSTSMDYNLTFIENTKREFEEFISNITLELQKTNNEYANLVKINDNILNEYPKLRKVVEDFVGQQINKRECSALAKYLSNLMDLKFMEYYAIFLEDIKKHIIISKKVD